MCEDSGQLARIGGKLRKIQIAAFVGL